MRHRQDGPDGGFSMVEIIVAIALMGVLAAAAVPLYITALRASVVAKTETAAKNLSQLRVEEMRNMPFRVAYDPAVTTSVDLLDIYYPNLTPAGGVTSAGLVTTGARNQGEPSGTFYRTRFTESIGGTDFTQYVATQFRAPGTLLPIAPAAGYDTDSLNDQAPSMIVGATVITTWQVGALTKRSVVFTEIGDVPPATALLTLQGRATALRVASTLLAPEKTDLVYEAGVVNLDGAVSAAPSAAVSATGASASLTPGSRITGATSSGSAPADGSKPAVTASTANLSLGGNVVVRLPRSDVEAYTYSSSANEPKIASSVTPVRAGSYGTADMSFTNRPNLADAALGLDDDDPVVFQPFNGGSLHARASGWANTTSGASHLGQVGLSARSDIVSVLKTSFASQGLVQMQLLSSSLGCTASATAPSATPAYTGQVRLWTYTPNDPANPVAGGVSAWGPWIPLSGTQATDPLATVNLTVGPGGTMVGVSGGRVVYLGEYLTSLSSQTADTLAGGSTVRPNGRGIEGSLPPMIGLTTVPLRAGEDLSSVNVELGRFSCVAEDLR